VVCTRGSSFAIFQYGKHGNENSPRIIHTFYIMENIAVKRMIFHHPQNMLCTTKIDAQMNNLTYASLEFH